MADDILILFEDLEKLLKETIGVLEYFSVDTSLRDFSKQVDHALLVVDGILRVLRQGIEGGSEFIRRRNKQLGKTKENLFVLLSEDVAAFYALKKHFTEAHALLLEYKLSFSERNKQKNGLRDDDKSWQLKQMAFLGYVEMSEEKKEEALHILEGALGQFFALSEKYTSYFTFF